MKPIAYAAAAVLCLSSMPSIAVAAEAAAGEAAHPWLQDGFLLNLGTFLQRKDLKVSARASLEAGDRVINFGQTFKGGEREDVLAANFHWRFRDHWWLSAELYSTRFRKAAVLEEDTYWRGVVFPAGSFAEGGFSTALYRVVVGRRILGNERSELGIGVGVHWLELGAYIEGELLVGEDVYTARRESVSADAPLPNLSVWYLHAFSRKWAATARWDWFSASINEYSGHLTNTQLGVVYQITPHLGLQLAYKRFQVDADIEKRGWYGQVEYTQSGPFLGLSGNW